jgi:hypothetical protein
MSQLKWFFVVFSILALTVRLVFADPIPDGNCWPPVTNMAAESLHQGGLDVADLHHEISQAITKPDEMSQDKIDAILEHLDSAKERWLKKISRRVCPKAKSDDDDDQDMDRGGGPGGGGMAKGSANDADSIMKQITKGIGLNTGAPDTPKKSGKKPLAKKDDVPTKETPIEPEILAKTDEVEDEIQNALDDREDECEAAMKKEMKTMAKGQMGQQQKGQQQQFGQGQMMQGNMAFMGQSQQGFPGVQGTQGFQGSQMGGLQSAYLNSYGSVYNTNNIQSYSRYYYNPYLQRYVGY